MGWREDTKFGIVRAGRLFLGESNGQMGAEVTATPEELNLLDNGWASVATDWTDGEDGTGVAQFTFSDAAGVTMATPIGGVFYISQVATGLTVDVADTSLVIATNGVITLVDTGVLSYWNLVSSAAGLLGFTLTAADDDYWFVFVHPSGKLVISGLCDVSGN